MGSFRTPPLPQGAVGEGKKCEKWRVRLVQRVGKDKRYSPAGDLKGMAGVPYQWMDKKGRLNAQGESPVWTGTPHPEEVMFGLKILPDYYTLYKDAVTWLPHHVVKTLGKKFSQYTNTCAIKISVVLNTGTDCKYIIPQNHRIPPPSSFHKLIKYAAPKGETRVVSSMAIDSNGHTIQNDINFYMLSTGNANAYLCAKYVDTPHYQTDKKTDDELFFKQCYMTDFGDENYPLGIYHLEATLGDASGHIDFYTSSRMSYLFRFAKRNISQKFYLWLFTIVEMTEKTTEEFTINNKKLPVCTFIFEHKHIQNSKSFGNILCEDTPLCP